MILSYYIALKVMYKKKLHVLGTNILNVEIKNLHSKVSRHTDIPSKYDETEKGPVAKKS